MKFTSVQWNIGGGFIRTEDSDPTSGKSYQEPGLDHIITTLQKIKPDIITLQETHGDSQFSQVAEIAKQLGLHYFVNDVYDKSHLQEGMGLGQAIISKWPLTDHSFALFLNPHYELITESGERWISHDKGVSRAITTAGTSTIEIQTLHMTPFRKFGADPMGPETLGLREDIVQKILPRLTNSLIQGDFNMNGPSLKPFFPTLFQEDVLEIEQNEPTTPKGRAYDHVLYRGLTLKSSKLITSVLTDHFPVVSYFE